MDQLFFVDVIDSASSGAAAHVRRKASLLEEVVGFDVTIVRLSFRHRPHDYIVVPWRLVARRVSAGPTIDYARFSLATIPIIVVSLLLGNVVAAEWNGFVAADSRSSRFRLVLHLMRLVVRFTDRLVFCGDSAYERYSATLFPRTEFVPLELGTVRSAPIATLESPTRTVRFIGSFQPWQGLELLCDSFLEVDRRGWTLELFGEGTLSAALSERVRQAESIVVRGPVISVEYDRALATAGVLVAPYDSSRGIGHQLSSLKSLDYCLTTRPVIVSSRDSLLRIDDVRSAVSAVDGTPEQLTAALAACMDVADSFPIESASREHRARAVLRERGPSAQRVALESVFSAARSRLRSRRRRVLGISLPRGRQ